MALSGAIPVVLRFAQWSLLHSGESSSGMKALNGVVGWDIVCHGYSCLSVMSMRPSMQPR
jgi:hypothetical protein